MTRCYITAPYPIRADAKAAMLVLADAGIGCTARWITQDDSAQLSHAWAQADLDDVRAADVLVALNPPEFANAGTGGRHVELGYALALGKALYLVGERTNIFHYHHTVTVCGTLDEARDRLVSR
jgi:nucleoside 2-deoxyribosyltransferase